MEQEKEQRSASGLAKDAIKVIKRTKLIVRLLSMKPLIITIIIGFLFLLFIAFLGMFMGGSSNGGGDVGQVQYSNLSETTLQWLDEVIAEAERQEVRELVPYVMAIIEVETKGTGTPDIMQSSESVGLGPNGFDNAEDSIRQGISYLKSGMLLGENLGFSDVWGVVQGYNFGTSYVSYLANNGEQHSTKVAQNSKIFKRCRCTKSW
ncbi:lysozyme family protein [Virgibacillus halodenitrificans]|uniref:lysozyme family protein n=1 Tax=Virgibacillus halodenitrificans TaxID=1482 RepID=UPI0009F9D3EC|nr:lysozyme family protein [Virgibacillus halodenitrificans]